MSTRWVRSLLRKYGIPQMGESSKQPLGYKLLNFSK
jgi:hypothetical protein